MARHLRREECDAVEIDIGSRERLMSDSMEDVPPNKVHTSIPKGIWGLFAEVELFDLRKVDFRDFDVSMS